MGSPPLLVSAPCPLFSVVGGVSGCVMVDGVAKDLVGPDFDYWHLYSVRLRGEDRRLVWEMANLLNVREGAVVRGLLLFALRDPGVLTPENVEGVRAAIGRAVAEEIGDACSR